MERGLDAILTEDLEAGIRNRLSVLLGRYDIFRVPRTIVYNSVAKALRFATAGLGFGGDDTDEEPAGQARGIEEFRDAWSRVRLGPVDLAVSEFNREIAEALAADPELADLKAVAHTDVSRLDKPAIRSLFDEAFQSVEDLLKEEIDGFRSGLSGWDEAKLYGSYTVWALVVVTAELALGGGFTILDALLGGAMIPLIPKWLLKLKVVDLLRDIGHKVDQQYRRNLHGILRTQADLYRDTFTGMLPGNDEVEVLQAHIRELGQGSR